MVSTSERIVGNTSGKQVLLEMARIQSEIADPTFGYMRGSSIEYRRADNAPRSGLVERDLGNVVYVDKLGRSESEMSLCVRRETARVDII